MPVPRMAVIVVATLFFRPIAANPQQLDLTAADASKIVEGCATHAKAKGQSHAIAVFDAGGNAVATLRMDGNGSGIMAFAMQKAEATATDPFLLNRFLTVDPITGDTVRLARAEFPLDFDQRHTLTAIARGKVPQNVGPSVGRAQPIAGLEGAVILRLASGLPFSMSDSTGDSLVGLPNGSRLPSSSSLDLLIRRPIRLGATTGGIYLDVRNVLNHQNVVAVRRDTGVPQATEEALQLMAEQAYEADPSPIPFESRRYRPEADLDGDGFVAGREELFPMYLEAASDYVQPIFAYGPPRLVRLGVELLF